MSTDNFRELNPVFFDKKGHRRRFVNYLTFVITAVFTILAGFFVVSVLINPFLPQLRLKPSAILPQKLDVTDALPTRPALSKKEASLRQVSERLKNEKLLREESKREDQARRDMLLSTKPAPTPPESVAGRPMSVGFYVNWDYSSYTSLKQNIDKLDWMVPEWIRISGDDANPLALDIDDKAMDLVHQVRPDIPILPLVQNYKNEQWNSDVLVRAISTEDSRQKTIAALLDVVTKNNFGGLTVDIEEVPERSHTDLYIFVNELHHELEKRNLILAQAVPFDDPDWNYTAFAGITDYLMLMGYDQHWSTGTPGPIAGEDWFDSILKKRMQELSPQKTIVCIGSYGYDWSDNGDEAETVSFEDSLITAKESLDNPEQIKFDPVSKNPYFKYDEDDGSTHTVWFLDAVSALGQIKNADSYNVAGVALWRMGSEDPSIWTIFGKDRDTSASELSTIKYGYDVDFDGNGEILQVKAVPHDGYRDIGWDTNGNATSEIYHQIPSSYVMQRTGDQPGKIALTFDDGPDPVWTPKILDILKAENVKAAFFVVGENAQPNPDLLKRIVNEGHDIGNHSFTHPNLGEVPNRITDLELNATQRLIESVTGRSTRLFRPPYFGDAEPRTPNEVEPAVVAQNLGYITVGLHLDPDDWKLTNDDGSGHTADQMVDEVLKQASVTDPEERGNIVLLHDGGGDRSATVEALPKLIDALRARGFQFVTVSDLAGISQEQAMPHVQEDQSMYAKTDAYIFYAMSIGGWLMRWVFLIGIVLGIGRMVVIGILALAQYVRSRRRERIHFGESFEPLVSVVVPAFNEEKVICRTIESLLASDYPKLEIIVVDDGSSDNTYLTAHEAFRDLPNVSVYSKPNGGKAEALNFGWRKANGKIIIALDADTLFPPETVSALAHRFVDEKIGAIAGNAKVGNRVNVVTKWQALPYGFPN